jgi:uncharacterized membrane protein (DUF4010 family)
MANIVFKSGIAAILGGWRLFLHLAIFFVIACGVGAALLMLWPS